MAMLLLDLLTTVPLRPSHLMHFGTFAGRSTKARLVPPYTVCAILDLDQQVNSQE